MAGGEFRCAFFARDYEATVARPHPARFLAALGMTGKNKVLRY